MREEIIGKVVECMYDPSYYELEHGKEEGVLTDFLGQFEGKKVRIIVETLDEDS